MPSLGGGGAEKVLVTILNNFDYKEYDVTLVLMSKTGVYVNDIPDCVNIVSLYSISSFFAKLEFNLYSRFKISILEKMRIRWRVPGHYHVIISFMEGRALRFHRYMIHRTERNIAWIHTDLYVNHYTIGNIISDKHERDGYEKMDKIIFVSNDAKKEFQRLYSTNAISKVIYNPIDKNYIQTFKPQNRLEDRFRIISIGRLTAVKAFDRLIKVAKRLKEDGLSFCVEILGEGEEKERLERMIEEYSLNEYVKLLGFKKPPYQWLANADLFVCTSIAEGFPLVQCESLCLGIPVVSTKCTGPVELLGKSEYGLLVNETEASIYTGVKEMIVNEMMYKHYKQKAIERSSIFSVSKTMDEIYSLLRLE